MTGGSWFGSGAQWSSFGAFLQVIWPRCNWALRVSPNTLGNKFHGIPSSSFAVLVLVAVVVYASAGRAGETENMTPLLLDVQDAPVPFMGSDGRVHLVYELWMANFSSADVSVEKVEVLGTDVVLQSLDAAAIAGQLQAAGRRESAGKLAVSTQGLLFLPGVTHEIPG